MKHTIEEIVNALKVIKGECYGTDCRDCPFGNDAGNCELDACSPAHWDIADEKPARWRALK